MHIAEGFLPAAQAVDWTVAAAPLVVHGARAVVPEAPEHPESTLPGRRGRLHLRALRDRAALRHWEHEPPDGDGHRRTWASAGEEVP